MKLFYDEDAANLNVTVVGGEGLAPKESTIPPNPYVRIYFLPDKRYTSFSLINGECRGGSRGGGLAGKPPPSLGRLSNEIKKGNKPLTEAILVVYHLQQLSGNSGWKVNGTRLFGSFQWKVSGSNGTSEKVLLFFRTECSKRKFVYHLFKPNL